MLSAIGARVVDRELPVLQAPDRFADGGELHEEELRDELVALLVELSEEDPAPLRAAA